MVYWANQIDAARYNSVLEAIAPNMPAQQISAGLAFANDADCVSLVRRLHARPLEEVASDFNVAERFRRFQTESAAGLEEFQRGAHLEDGDIVVFEVDATKSNISRYAPYYFYPDAAYSAGILHLKEGAKVTAMRNPWRDFRGVSLGEVFEEIGGGGHRRVASVILPSSDLEGAQAVLGHVLRRIRGAAREIADTGSQDD